MAPPNHLWSANQSQIALLEYANLKQSCPPGVYVSTTPGSSATWQGVYFVQKGTYATAVLRFRVLIPPEFPERAPSIVFSSDLFHPLIVPLSTYTFSNASPPRKPQKAGDELRLAPGSLNLGYGFPEWFRKRGVDEMATPMERRVQEAMADSPSPAQGVFDDADFSGDEYEVDTPSKRPAVARPPPGGGIAGMGGAAKRLMFIPPPAVDALEYSSTRSYSGMAAVMEYMTQAFEDDEFLDGVGIDDAANPSAMHAWHAYRVRAKESEEIKRLKEKEKEREREREREREKEQSNGNGDAMSGASTPKGNRNSITFGSAVSLRMSEARMRSQSPRDPRDPGQWDWNGVWLDRVKKCVKTSSNEATLYKESIANSTGNREDDIIEMIRFLDLEKEDVNYIKGSIHLSQRDRAQTTLQALKNEAREENWAKGVK